MADSEPERRGLNSERWAELREWFGEDCDELTFSAPIEINGWVYMPAVYFPA